MQQRGITDAAGDKPVALAMWGCTRFSALLGTVRSGTTYPAHARLMASGFAMISSHWKRTGRSPIETEAR